MKRFTNVQGSYKASGYCAVDSGERNSAIPHTENEPLG
jgi:hypothetical protein